MSDVPDDFPFKSSMTYGGPGQEDFVGWACGGSHVVAPTSECIVAPTFDVETILYADLQAKMIKVVKSVFDALGHYARWDLVSLSGPPAPYEPLTSAGRGRRGGRVRRGRCRHGTGLRRRLRDS